MAPQLKNIIETTAKEALYIASHLATTHDDEKKSGYFSNIDINTRSNAGHHLRKLPGLPKQPWAPEPDWWAPF